MADADVVGIVGRHKSDGDWVTLSHIDVSLGDFILVGGGGRAQERHRSVVVGARAIPERWVPVDGRKEWGWKSHLESSVRTGVPFRAIHRIASLGNFMR